MPTLDWIGKKAVIEHHKNIPFRLLKFNKDFSVGNPGNGNLLVQGDNLEALKALLPYYAGQVKCIYADPPYNTGNESWIYNDNVNSPEIQEWLGKVVGREAEDLSRHDKWLCMMYPRLKLLHKLLAEDGAIFISIDDNEQHLLRMLMDEIFGEKNFICNIIWQKKYSPQNDANYFSDMHDFIICYAKNKTNGNGKTGWSRNLLPQTEALKGRYSNIDNDPRGPWKSSDLTVKTYSKEYDYPIETPSGRIVYPTKGRCWMTSQENMKKLIEDNRIWFGKTGNNVPALKRFLSEVQQGIVPTTIWSYQEVGHNQQAKQDIKRMLGNKVMPFDTPKPVALIMKILRIATDKDSIILDSFAGSGTTGHAVLRLNKEDKGNRKFILIEMVPEIMQTITVERLKRAINGYSYTKNNQITEHIEGLGSGFQFCELGTTLFNEIGHINPNVSFENLARHIFFIENGTPLEGKIIDKNPLLSIYNDVAVYLIYNGVLRDKSPQGGNVLTTKTLSELLPHSGLKIIYGTSCRIGQERLKQENIVFKQIPYEVKVN